LNNGAAQMPPTNVTLAYSIIADHVNTNPNVVQAALDVRGDLGPSRNVLTLNGVMYSHNSLNDNSGAPIGDPAGTFSFQTAPLVAPNPGFAAAGSPSFNYHLTANSPAIDRAFGSNAVVDLDGAGRVGVPDLGAYEFQPPPVPARDSVGVFNP